MHEFSKSLVVILPPGQNPAALVQPLDRPASLVAAQLAPILHGWPDPVTLVRGDQLNAIGGEFCIERITVVGTISDKSFGESHCMRWIPVG